MAADAATIARPYAEAVFSRAQEAGELELWSDMLALLALLVQDPDMARVIRDPLFDREQLTGLIIEICDERLNNEGRNLVRLLVQNGRTTLLPEVARIYELLKDESLKVLNVHVRAAYALQQVQKKNIAAALEARLGRKITITSEKDTALIGGIHIRAGDMVIDGSVRGQLQQLSNELGI